MSRQPLSRHCGEEFIFDHDSLILELLYVSQTSSFDKAGIGLKWAAWCKEHLKKTMVMKVVDETKHIDLSEELRREAEQYRLMSDLDCIPRLKGLVDIAV